MFYAHRFLLFVLLVGAAPRLFFSVASMDRDDRIERFLTLVRAHPDVWARHPDCIAFKRRAVRQRDAELVIADFPAAGSRTSRFRTDKNAVRPRIHRPVRP